MEATEAAYARKVSFGNQRSRRNMKDKVLIVSGDHELLASARQERLPVMDPETA